MDCTLLTNPHPAPPENFNLAQFVLRHAERLPDKPAISAVGNDPECWSYGSLAAAIKGTASGLREMGLSPGDSLLMRFGNRIDFPVAFLGAIWAGIIPVPSSAQLSGTEINALSTQLGTHHTLFEDGISLPDRSLSRIPLGALRKFYAKSAMPPEIGSPNRHAYTIFTSGTSGKPRGVRHAHRAVWARQMMHKDWYKLHESDRVLHSGAFNWTYTLGTGLLDPWIVGATALVPPGIEIADLSSLIAQNDATIFASVPGVYRKMLREGLVDMPSLRHGVSAGEKLPENLRKTWRAQTGTDLFEALGMSECSTFISANPRIPAKEGSSGRPQRGRQIAVLDDAQKPVPFDSPGQLAVHRSEQGLMIGYLDQDFSEEWFETGDIVSMSAEHDIIYLGRADDIMTAGGYRVSPLEVEHCFTGLPGLEGCAAAPVEIKPEVFVIALFYSAETPITDTHFDAQARSQLAAYKRPRLYIHRADLPTSANGKINRRALRESFKAPT